MADLRRVLLIDNDPGHAEAFREALLIANDGPFQGEYAKTLSQGVERLRQKGIWAIFANLSLPDSQGLDTFRKLLQAAPDVPTLILGGIDEEGIAREALR
jgi:DNA-binding NarL/FixJ family response regulator